LFIFRVNYLDWLFWIILIRGPLFEDKILQSSLVLLQNKCDFFLEFLRICEKCVIIHGCLESASNVGGARSNILIKDELTISLKGLMITF
jgi:hypothetical protein